MTANDGGQSADWPGVTLMILGAARCGTSSLHEFFRRHQDVCASSPKEPAFFEDEYAMGLDHYQRTYFPHWSGERVVVEGRPTNLILPYVARRIQHSYPGARFIVSLRDPAERAFSHWALKHSLGTESRPFARAIQQNYQRLKSGNVLEGPDGERLWREALRRDSQGMTQGVYLQTGFYAAHLKRFFSLFPRERFCILTVNDLRAHSAEVAQQLLHFAGLDPSRGPASLPHEHANAAVGLRMLHRIDRALHVPQIFPPWLRKRVRAWTAPLQRRRRPSPETMRWLRDYYAPHDRELCELLGWAKCPWQSEG